MKIRTKIFAMGVLLPIVPVLIVLSLIVIQRQRLAVTLEKSLDMQIRTQMSMIAKDVYSLCRTQNDSVQQALGSSIRVARDVVRRTGAVSLGRDTIPWKAKNQLTGEIQEIDLPRLLVGKTWPGQVTNTSEHVPVVDETVDLVGGACTIFQKMNEQGDMLRVATNVVGKDGARAIGMLFVGVKQENVVSFRQSIDSITIGASGYVFVVGGSGDTRGEPT